MFVVLKKNLRDDAKDEAENEEDDVYFGDQHSGRGFECREAYYCMYHYSGCRMEEKKYVLMKMKLHFEKNYLRVCAVFCVSKDFVCLSKKKKTSLGQKQILLGRVLCVLFGILNPQPSTVCH